MSFFDTLSQMVVILFAIVLGYLANRLGILGKEVDGKLSKLVLTITMPAMILGSVMGNALPDTAVVLSMLKVAVFFYGIEFILAFIVPRFLGGTPEQKGVWRYTLVFPNMAFIGYTVVMKLFGPETLFYAIVLALPFNLFSFSLGPLMLVGAKRFRWRQLLSPCIVASLTALLIALARIRIPALLGEMLNLVGGITAPLSLLVVGSLLAGLPVKQVFASPRLWVLTGIRLVALPVLLWLILRGIGVAPVVLGIAVTEMSMPTAVNGSMLCLEYGGDTEAMAQIIFLTTLVSIVTIPLVAMLLL